MGYGLWPPHWHHSELTTHGKLQAKHYESPLVFGSIKLLILCSKQNHTFWYFCIKVKTFRHLCYIIAYSSIACIDMKQQSNTFPKKKVTIFHKFNLLVRFSCGIYLSQTNKSVYDLLAIELCWFAHTKFHKYFFRFFFCNQSFDCKDFAWESTSSMKKSKNTRFSKA